MKELNHKTTAITQARDRSKSKQLKPHKAMYVCKYRRERFGWFSKRGKSCWAYYAVCGSSNYYRKKGLNLANADPHKWQERTSVAGILCEEKRPDPKYAKSGSSHSVLVNVFHGHGQVSHATNPNPAPFAIHSQPTSPDHASHLTLRHGSGLGHFSWFFMSHWNLPGLNPYAISSSSHSSGKVKAGNVKTNGPAVKGERHESQKIHIHESLPQTSHPSAHAKAQKPKTPNVFVGPPISFFEAANRIKAIVSSDPFAVKQHAVHRTNPIIQGPNVPSFNPIQDLKPGSSKTKVKGNGFRVQVTEFVKADQKVSNPSIKIQDHAAAAASSRSPIGLQDSKPETPVRGVGYIPSRAPLKVIPKLVVGAEALPE